MNRRILSLVAILPVAALFAAEPAPTPRPKTVTLTATDEPLSKVLAQLTKQTGIAVEDRRSAADTPVSVALKDMPFWEALDAIAARAEARVYLHSRDGRIALVKRDPKAPPPQVSYAGPFRTSLKRTHAVRDLETGSVQYMATFETVWEPSLQPFFLDTYPRGMVVTVDGKKAPVPEAGQALSPVDNRSSLVFDVPLPAQDRDVKKLSRLEGKLTAVVPTEMLTFDFGPLDKLAQGPVAAKTEKGVSCQIKKVALDNDVWRVQLEVEYPKSDVKFESFQSWVVNNELALVDKDGRRYPSTSYYQENAGTRTALLTYNFEDKGALKRGRATDYKLAYRTPGGIIEMPVPFSFQGVDLP